MSAYTDQSEIEAQLPPDFLVQALDDDNDGSADSGLLDQVIENASEEVDSLLGQRYTTPFVSPFPPVVSTASRFFVLEMLYLRRGFHGEANPWTARADKIRERLSRIGKGEEPLSPDHDREKPSVSIISDDAKTHSSGGRISL